MKPGRLTIAIDDTAAANVRALLEAGTMNAFAPARLLYASLGFRPGPPFAGYSENPHSVCMTRAVSPSNRSSL